MYSSPICLCSPFSDLFPPSNSTPNPIYTPPTECKVSPNISSGFRSLGLSRCCSLCLENIYSVPSHPDQFLHLQDSAQMSLLGRRPRGNPRYLHNAMAPCTPKTCHIALLTGLDPQLPPHSPAQVISPQALSFLPLGSLCPIASYPSL